MTDHELIAAIRLLREEIEAIRMTASQVTKTFALPTPPSLKKEPFASLHESPPSVQDLWLWPSYPSASRHIKNPAALQKLDDSQKKRPLGVIFQLVELYPLYWVMRLLGMKRKYWCIHRRLYMALHYEESLF